MGRFKMTEENLRKARHFILQAQEEKSAYQATLATLSEDDEEAATLQDLIRASDLFVESARLLYGRERLEGTGGFSGEEETASEEETTIEEQASASFVPPQTIATPAKHTQEEKQFSPMTAAAYTVSATIDYENEINMAVIREHMKAPTKEDIEKVRGDACVQYLKELENGNFHLNAFHNGNKNCIVVDNNNKTIETTFYVEEDDVYKWKIGDENFNLEDWQEHYDLRGPILQQKLCYALYREQLS